MQEDYEISNSTGEKIGAIAQDRASGSWWIMGNTERFRTEPDAFSFWLANYDHQTGVLRDLGSPESRQPSERVLGDTMLPSYLE